MNAIRLLIATTFMLHAIEATAQRPDDLSLLRAIGSLNYSLEPSARKDAIQALGVTFFEVDGYQATLFRQIGDAPLIHSIYFMGGPSAEIRVSFAKTTCVSLLSLEHAYGVKPKHGHKLVHVSHIKGGDLRGVPVWIFEFPPTDKSRRSATAGLSEDERCVNGLTFYSHPS